MSMSHLKPHKSEAIHRIRLNTLSLVTLLVLSYLLPLPSIPTAIHTVLLASTPSIYGSGLHQQYSYSQVWVWACVIEMGMVAVMGYNLLEAAYAIKYPPAPLPPVPSKVHKPGHASPSPASPSPIAASPSSPFSSSQSLSRSQRPFRVLSPHSSPQPQRPFAYNPSAHQSLDLDDFSASSSSPMYPSRTGADSGVSPRYAQSPISTPSRVLHYTAPPSASTASNASASTSSEYLATPSPVISAYRGKHITGDVGRALDGSYLSMMMNQTPQEYDEDE